MKPTQVVSTKTAMTFKVSRFKLFLALTFFALMFVVGFYADDESKLVRWFMSITGALGLFCAIWVLFSKRVFLKLTPGGFEVGAIFKMEYIRWTEVTGFRIDRLNGAKVIAIDFTPEHMKKQALRQAGARFLGMGGYLFSFYPESTEQLLQHLNEWHAQYGKK
jgi:hypothetical protein